jgi:hypothetical protein
MNPNFLSVGLSAPGLSRKAEHENRVKVVAFGKSCRLSDFVRG